MSSRRAIAPEDSQLERIVDYPAEIALLEEQMKHGTDHEITNSRVQLCERFSDWILHDPEEAAAGDAVNQLWRKCFYERIAFSRKIIAKNKKRRVDLTESMLFLTAFLNEGITLMSYLIDRLKNRIITMAKDDDDDTLNGGVQCLTRLYISLGDLYRYDEKFDKASSSYHMASNLAPGMTHCFNQLAVVSDCKESTAVAAYWYVRSIHAEERVPKSETNLQLLLKNNRNWLSKQGHAAPILANAATKLFVSKFVDLYYAGILKEHIDPKVVLNCVNSFQTLLASSAFSDSLLCKLITILAANDTYMYDFGLCLVERVIAMLGKKATRRTLVPALLLIEYLLIKPDGSKTAFWRNVVTVWNTVALQEVESEQDRTIKEYVALKGFKPFEPFIGKIPGYFLSNTEACAQFDKTQVESETPSARILRFRTLKPALLQLDCVIEGPNGSLWFQEPKCCKGSDMDSRPDRAETEFKPLEESMEYEEGDDIVLSVPTPVQPTTKRQAVSSSPIRPVATTPAPLIGVVAPMAQVPPQTASLPLLSGHVAPFHAQERVPFGHQAASTATIGPPPGFPGMPLFGNTSSVPTDQSFSSMFQLNPATANPFAYGDSIIAPSGNHHQGYSSTQSEKSKNCSTSNPFAM